MSKTKLTGQDKALILYGYLWRIAEECKKKGLFKDLTVKEIIEAISSEYGK